MLKAVVADDDKTITLICSRLLKELGFDVITYSDGTSALEQLCSNQPPDLAILDWQMPDLTGLEVSSRHESLNNPYHTYKILLSGLVDKENMLVALQSGFNDILIKPIDRNLFNSRISVAKKIILEKKSLEEMNEVINKYAHQMEILANERAKQLVHADRMSSLGVMYAGISHEINNPLSFISGNTQQIAMMWKVIEPIVRESLSKSENLEEQSDKIKFVLNEMPDMLSSIMNGVDRVSTIVKGLKRFSSKQSITKEAININDSIIQAIELNKYSLNKLKVETNLSATKIIVQGNSIELEQVLTNLIINSAHATENINEPKLVISSECINNQAVITLKDNGKGIPEDVILKIWEPFFTTKPVGKGTGLGLSVSTGIIRDHGGKLTVSSIVNQGATFVITLPLK
jgi:signal transduction histidine kinase